MKLIVKNGIGDTVTVQIRHNETFLDLKERMEEEAGISLDLHDMEQNGKRITETQRVMEYFLSFKEPDDGNNVFCAVPGCKNTKFDNPDKVFFEFPAEDFRRCHQWVLYCQRLDAGPGKKRLNVDADSTICSDHFRPDQFVKNTNTLLKRTAVPCVQIAQSAEPSSSYKIANGNDYPKINEVNIKTDIKQENIYVSDELPLRLCRLCACTSVDYVMLYDEIGLNLKIAKKINLCLPITVQMTDGLPKQICKLCLKQLEELFELQDMCTLTQEKLWTDIEESCIVNEEMAVVSLDDAGEEVILGSVERNVSKEEINEINESCCPLCKDGTLTLTNKKKKLDEGRNTPIFCGVFPELDPLDLEETDQNNSIDKVDDVFSDFPVQLNCNKIEDPLKIINEKSSDTIMPTIVYDVSSLDSQRGNCSLEGFCKEENDPLKPDSPKSNEPSNDCYSSFASPFSLMGNDETNGKNIQENTLSPIKELPIESELCNLGNESETACTDTQGESNLSDSYTGEHFLCRICAFEFSNMKELLKHSFAHSCTGFYQCSACVTFFRQKGDLEKHFECHEASDLNILTCNVCHKTFNTPLTLASHSCKPLNSTEVSSIKNRCPFCNKFFRNEQKLKSHMKYHETPRPVYCRICNKLFSDEVKLQRHNINAHSNKQSHCCEECGKVFKSEASMRYHQRSHQDEDSVRPYTCDRCGKTFNKKHMLANHMTSSHKHTNFETSCFTCKLCYEVFPTTGTAVAHMERHHKFECLDETTYSFEMHTINRLFVCEYCERCYAEGNILNTHRDQHVAEAPYECKACSTSFGSVEDMKSHYDNHAKEEIPGEYSISFSIPKTYLCEYCERCFLNSVKYNEHLTIHYGTHPYQCRHCSEKCATLIEALEHRAFHGDITIPQETYNYCRPFQCHYCNNSFAIEDALIKHIRMHTGEKPFICDTCGKGFSQSSGLYTHQKVHSSERPYSCSVCPRTFKIKGDRDVHVRKHSGDRPYKCEFCGKAFMTQHVYSQHRKIHTGERPYKCDVCGFTFRRSHVLTVHKRIHTGEKPNACDICHKKYRQKGDMLKHKRIQHGIINNLKQAVNSVVNC